MSLRRFQLAALLLIALPALLAPAQPPAQNPAVTRKGMSVSDVRIRLHLISQMIQTGRLDEAEKAIEVLRSEAGKEPLIDGMEAFLFYRRHEYPAAKDQLVKALATSDPPTWWRILLGMSLFANGDEDAAREAVLKAQNEDPRGAAEGLISMGAAGVQDFNQSPSVEGALTLCFLHRTMGNRRQELVVLDTALRRFPKEPRLIVARLGLIADAAPASRMAEEADKALKDAEQSDQVQARAGALFAKANQYPKAMAAYRKAVELNPRNFMARLDLANVLQHEKKLDESLVELAAVVTAAPPPPQEYLLLGIAGQGSLLGELKRWKEAETVLLQGLTLSADSMALMNNLAWIYATSEAPDVRNPAKAVELASKAATLSKNRNSAVLDTLAEAYFAAGNRDKAIETARRAVALAPTNEEYKKSLARFQAAPATPPK